MEIKKEIKQDENLYIFYNIIELLYNHYRDKLSKDIIRQLYKLYKETLKEVEKNYENLDIREYEIIERIIFEDNKH